MAISGLAIARIITPAGIGPEMRGPAGGLSAISLRSAGSSVEQPEQNGVFRAEVFDRTHTGRGGFRDVDGRRKMPEVAQVAARALGEPGEEHLRVERRSP